MADEGDAVDAADDGPAVGAAVEAGEAFPPLLLPSAALVGVGITLCPGVVYSVPKSGAGNGPVYNNGTLTTEYTTAVVVPVTTLVVWYGANPP